MMCVLPHFLDPPGVCPTPAIDQWPDNPQLFTNPHWQCSYNVYCLPVIGMNNIPTQKNNMSWFWFLFVREQNVQLNSSCGIFFSTTLIRSFNLATPKVVLCICWRSFQTYWPLYNWYFVRPHKITKFERFCL